MLVVHCICGCLKLSLKISEEKTPDEMAQEKEEKKLTLLRKVRVYVCLYRFFSV